MELEGVNFFEKWIHKWGCSISEAILDSECNYFKIPEVEGFIGYRLAYRCAVVLGDPVCAPEKKGALAEAFQKYCQEKKWNYIYFIASKQFSRWAINHICKIMIEVGEEIIFNPLLDPTAGHKGHKLRNYIHHAEHVGLVVREYISCDLELEKSILEVGKTWEKGRRGPQIYLGHLNFFTNKEDKRWFYLKNHKQDIIGMALLSRLEACQGWLLKFLITVPYAPRGASEFLMVSILNILREEDCHFVTFGIVPADNLGEMIGLSKFSKLVAKGLFKMAKWIFHLGKRRLYWQKFHPHHESSYLLFSGSTISLEDMRALGSTMKIDF